VALGPDCASATLGDDPVPHPVEQRRVLGITQISARGRPRQSTRTQEELRIGLREWRPHSLAWFVRQRPSDPLGRPARVDPPGEWGGRARGPTERRNVPRNPPPACRTTQRGAEPSGIPLPDHGRSCCRVTLGLLARSWYEPKPLGSCCPLTDSGVGSKQIRSRRTRDACRRRFRGTRAFSIASHPLATLARSGYAQANHTLASGDEGRCSSRSVFAKPLMPFGSPTRPSAPGSRW
jgi:hypothetical protein